MPTPQALGIAEEKGLDLVEVSPTAKPPVCRIMDYGKYKYEQKKKRASAKAKGKGHVASLREIKLRPRTDEHDLGFKLRKARDFLVDGDKVKVTLMFRGREIVHKEIGRQQLRRVTEMLGNLATVENPPRLEGRFMSMILVPNREGVQELKRAMRAEQAAEETEPGEKEPAAEAEETASAQGE